jgi:hypothetical protein
MKRYAILILFGFFTVGLVTAQNTGGRIMYVSIKAVELKSSTGFFADTLGILEYGDQVTVLRESGRWVEVRPAKNASLTGWTASANLTTKRIVSSSGRTSASAEELALAGKGFSEEVEHSYRQDAVVSYAEIDAMEAQNIPKWELYDFLKEGHLSAGDNQ